MLRTASVGRGKVLQIGATLKGIGAGLGLDLVRGRRLLLHQIPVAVATMIVALRQPAGFNSTELYVLLAAAAILSAAGLSGVLLGTQRLLWAKVIPTLDIVVISLLAGIPQHFTLSILLIFPVMWLAAEVNLLAIVLLALLPVPLVWLTHALLPIPLLGQESLPSFAIPLVVAIAGVGVNRITLRERLRRNLATLQLQALSAELLESQQRVLSITHEIRTPLTSVVGYLDLALEDDDLSEPTRHRLLVALQNSDRLLVLIATLLLTARERDRAVLDRAAPVVRVTVPVPVPVPAPVPAQGDLSELVHRAVEAIAPLAARGAITIERGDWAVAAPQVLDPIGFRQVLDNVLSNAVKYNRRPGRVTIELRWAAASAQQSARRLLCVTDTGNGMSMSEQSQLFRPFYRTAAALASGLAGSGLGLGISREIMRRLGGDLYLESESGAGTTVFVLLPLEWPAN
ncbi:MAG: sensor histidine kinase [Microbacteriaceae bacterium]|nr:sensor histidine kinase [Microbacteriaceae bacterium]